MKFKELNLKSRFTTDDSPGTTFIKVKYKNASCCTSAHNAVYNTSKGKQVRMFEQDDVVYPEEEPVVEEMKQNPEPIKEVKQEAISPAKPKTKKEPPKGGGSFGP